MDSIGAIKRRFTVIISGLSLLFIVNIFYLTELYYAIKSETGNIVFLSIEDADNEELQLRLEAISLLSDSSIHSISIDKSYAVNSDFRDNDEKSYVNTIIFNQLMKEIRLTVHQNIDSILPVDLQKLDSLILSNFEKRGIHSQLHCIEIIDLNTGNLMSSFQSSNTKTKDGFYLYEYDTENKYAYKIYTASLTGVILRRMSGILATTFLTIILLGYVFIYFIRTVVKLKTLEEMKRDFTNNMTHELKTPISVAYSAVDIC